jgi:hypothetical protein
MKIWESMRAMAGTILLATGLLGAGSAQADIVTLNSDQAGDYTFQSNTTYYIATDMTIWGTATFQGGTVIKNAGQLTVESLDCETASNNPAIFTGPDDDSVGDILSGSTGDPTHDYVPVSLGIDADTNIFLHDMDFYNNYAGTAVNFNDTDTDSDTDYLTYTIWNVVMQNVWLGINMENGGGEDSINVTNLVMSNCGGIANGYFLQGNIANSTFMNVSGFVSDIWGYGYQNFDFSWCTFSNTSLSATEVNVGGSDNGFADCGNFYLYDYIVGETDGSNYFGSDWYYLANLEVPVNFTLWANLYSPTNVEPLEVNVLGGVPLSVTMLVNDTNTADAVWEDFTSTNLVVTLGSTDGVYNVKVGLSNLPEGMNPVWRNLQITLDTTPPVITITNPVSPTVTRPYLQLQGYANEEVTAISYDLTNAAGAVSNVMGFVTGEAFDTNLFDYTTNFFQCYDVPLTNGLNAITLRVTDRAGNMTVTNLNYTLDYSVATNPPVISLIWPQPGMLLSGTNFTLRGMLNDETATVSAQITDTNGDTNVVTGLVERGGRFWEENLPLSGGTNSLTVTATDAAGNVTVTNFTVVQSALTFTMNPIYADMFQPVQTVTGKIGDPDDTVEVNGVEGVNNGDGTWEADNVPTYGNGTGTATFDAAAFAAGQTTPASGATQSVDTGAAVHVVSYNENETDKTHSSNGSTSKVTLMKEYSAQYSTGQTPPTYSESVKSETVGTSSNETSDTSASYEWSDTNAVGTVEWYEDYTPDTNDDESGTNAINWPADGYGELGSIPDYDGTSGAYAYHYCAKGANCSWDYGGGDTEETTLSASTKANLYVGGKAQVGKQVLVCVTYTAEEIDQPATGGHITALGNDMTTLSTALGQQVNSYEHVWILVPEGAVMGATLTAPPDHYAADATDVVKYHCYFDVFVDQPDPTGTHLFTWADGPGHAWWRIRTDAPSYAINKFIPSQLIPFLNIQVGFGPTNTAWVNPLHPSAPGEFRYPETDIYYTTNGTYDIGFSKAVGGLTYTKDIYNNAGTYNMYSFNCVDAVISAASSSGLSLPDNKGGHSFSNAENFGKGLPRSD